MLVHQPKYSRIEKTLKKKYILILSSIEITNPKNEEIERGKF